MNTEELQEEMVPHSYQTERLHTAPTRGILEAFADSQLRQHRTIQLVENAIEVRASGQVSPTFSIQLENFMGTELTTLEKSEVLCFAIHYASISKGKVSLLTYRLYCLSLEAATTFRDQLIRRFYTRHETDFSQDSEVPRKKFLFFVSPKSGKGNAIKIYQAARRALNISCQKVETQKRNHALEYVRDLSAEEFRKIDGIITVSGDGIPHEVINGFYLRPDHDSLTLNMGLLPGGSGCALLYNILQDRGLSMSEEAAVFVATRFNRKNKLVFKFTIQPSGQVIYGLLNNLVGLFSDIDFGSEKLRCLGALRFDVYGALMLICPKSRNVNISWKEVLTNQTEPEPLVPTKRFSEEEEPLGDNNSVAKKDRFSALESLKQESNTAQGSSELKTKTGKIYFLNFHTVPFMSIGIKVSPTTKINGTKGTMTFMPKKAGWCNLLCYTLNFSSGKFADNPDKYGLIHEDVQYIKVTLVPENSKKGDQTYPKKHILGVDGERYEAREIEGAAVQGDSVFFLC